MPHPQSIDGDTEQLNARADPEYYAPQSTTYCGERSLEASLSEPSPGRPLCRPPRNDCKGGRSARFAIYVKRVNRLNGFDASGAICDSLPSFAQSPNKPALIDAT
jgi:hypothetical protein